MSYRPTCDIRWCSGPAWSMAAMALIALLLGVLATLC